MPLSEQPALATNYEYTTTNIPAFLSKLWTLVEDTKYDELIAWDPSGFSFHVFDQTRFAREILPRFFKHNNMASFIRQLNMYGFRKVNSIEHGSLKVEKEDMEFHHPYFIKGKEQFLEYIKRKVPDLKVISNAISNTNQPQNQQAAALSIQYPQIKPDELNKVLDDVNIIKSKQKMVDDSLFNVKKENEALWKEIASLRQKHHHQQQIVNKLIHFLVHLVNPSTMGGIKRSRPLMIDSHSAAVLVNSGVDSAFNDCDESNVGEVDNEEDEEILVNVSNSKKPKRISQLIELDDDEEEDEEDAIERTESSSLVLKSNSKSFAQIRPNRSNKSDNISNYIEELTDSSLINSTNPNLGKKRSNDYEIETINKAKNSNPENILYRTTKRLRNTEEESSVTFPQEIRRDLQTNENSNQGSYKDLGLSNVLNDTLSTTGKNEIVESTLTLPITDITAFNQNCNNSNNNNNITQYETSNSPIITLPESPNLINNSKHNSVNNLAMMINNDSNNIVDLQQPNESLVPDNLNRSISSSNQMSDHVESLQLDLNSIKEFLTNNALNQMDTFTINNLFSPNILDPSENESFYMEAALPSLSSGMLNNISNRNIDSSNYVQTNSNESNINNGKIVGNELIQYEPFNSVDCILTDDIYPLNSVIKSTIQDPPAPLHLTDEGELKFLTD